MDRQKILQTLEKYIQEHREDRGIIALGIFGSFARNEAGRDSDVDVVVSLARPNLLTLSRIRQELEQELHLPVDIVSFRPKMNPFLKEVIERDACYV